MNQMTFLILKRQKSLMVGCKKEIKGFARKWNNLFYKFWQNVSSNNWYLHNLLCYFSDNLKPQLSSLSVRPKLLTASWTLHIYQKIMYAPVVGSVLNCVFECCVLDVQVCDLMVFENNICYKGAMANSSGTVLEMYSSVTLYYKTGEYLSKN